MTVTTYYDKDAKLDIIQNERVAVIGYGIQGRAQALNLRDSGVEVIVGNRSDSYSQNAIDDGFEPVSIEEAVKSASTTMLLIPDQAHKKVYLEIEKHLKPDDLLIIAHGYSWHFREVVLPPYLDAVLLAPRMPGKPIRSYYLNNGGVPAFFDVFQDATGKAKNRGLSIAKALGFTRAGVMQVSVAEETEIDLFMEQFLIPSIIKTMIVSFQTLIDKGYCREAVLMELYASGELGEVILEASKTGLFEVFKQNSSPTCQVGINNNIETVLSKDSQNTAELILENIRNGNFSKQLDIESEEGFPQLEAYDKKNAQSELTQTFRVIDKIIKFRSIK
jgi:ketol-acid reductoisomerase